MKGCEKCKRLAKRIECLKNQYGNAKNESEFFQRLVKETEAKYEAMKAIAKDLALG